MAEQESGKRKRGSLLLPVLVGLLLAAAAGGGGFWAVTEGPFASAQGREVAAEDPGRPGDAEEPPALPDTVFVALDPVVISLGPDLAERHLMFTAHLEVAAAHEEEVTRLLPRVLDVLNSYLRVIDLSELGEPTSLARIRAQILRRIQVVTGTGRVQDLLVTQFVVN